MKSPWITLLFIVAALLATWLAYAPGLGGGYLFDDFANLPALGDTGRINSVAALARYVTSGTADPTGRPVALLSFLVDAQNWPADPLPFKRTNLLLHLLNGLLLFVTLRRLGRVLEQDGRWTIGASENDIAALIATTIWLLHPRFVSTTLYIVQREAMIPATFILLGILGWLTGRSWLLHGRIRRGLIMEGTSLVLCTVLATLSKANGALLPLFILVLEYTLLPAPLLKSSSDAAGWHSHVRLRATLCWSAAILLAAYLFYEAWVGMAHGIGYRRWSMGQRLLTEPRIVWSYLRELWFPHPYSAGLFNDAYPVSTDLLHPWTTLPAIAATLVVVFWAIRRRRRHPMAALAILFFFVGHLLESTSIALELYFEHRNYIPGLFLFWPLALWIAGARRKCDGALATNATPHTLWRGLAGSAIIAMLWTMTWINASLWGNVDGRAAIWAALNPGSPRAQVTAAQADMKAGHPDLAIARLEPLLQIHADEVQIAFNLLSARCAMGGVREADLVAANTALRTTHDPGALIVSWYDQMIPYVKAGGCSGMRLEDLDHLASEGVNNPLFSPGRLQDLAHARGAIQLAQGNAVEALRSFDDALRYDPRLDTALAQAAQLGSAGYPEMGLRHLSTFDRLPAPSSQTAFGMSAIHAWVLARQGYWQNERASLENTLRADLANHP